MLTKIVGYNILRLIPIILLGIKEMIKMKLSTKGRYGLKAMFQLSILYGDGPIPLKLIAEKQNIPDQYLEQLVAALRKEGYVKSVRGAQGGYMLALPPEKITVGDIIRTLEGPVAPSECVIDDDTSVCTRKDCCVTRVVWEKIRDSINNVVDSITLQDMLNDYNSLANKDDYNIF